MLERSYRLLAAQEGFYYGHELRDNKADFNVAEYVVIEGEFDVDRFYQANKSVLADIETLSFVFRSHDGHGRQQHLPRPVKLELVDLRGLSTGFEIALSQMTVDSAKPFDITNDVLYRQCLYRISDSCQL
ncbi:condensation domain-containing protein, partial [Burkholderia pseudomallei]